jgi:hypothetical protein
MLVCIYIYAFIYDDTCNDAMAEATSNSESNNAKQVKCIHLN